MLYACLGPSLGSITGSVSDTSGAAVQNTDVTTLNPDTSLKRSAHTNSSGLYNFEDLTIVNYTVTIPQGRFAKGGVYQHRRTTS